MKILLATKNRHKVHEMRALLASLPFELLSAADMPELPEVDEDQPTLAGNAMKKAETLLRITGLPSLADDTGLEVEALGGAPGVFSSRYSGPGATYASNVAKLLRALDGVPAERRHARFRTVIAFARPEGTQTVEGVCEGEIIQAPRGDGGFGYDPVFLISSLGKTLAELSLEEKNRISHRGAALRRLRELLAAESGTR